MTSNNPNVYIISTPGRLLHLIVEMNLDLKSIQYVIFDADRLFERTTISKANRAFVSNTSSDLRIKQAEKDASILSLLREIPINSGAKDGTTTLMTRK
ncbi:hypothetical protein JOM56_009369 [Amanita muscaria]